MSETPESLRTEAQRLDRQAAYEFNAGDTAAASRCNTKAGDLRRKARRLEDATPKREHVDYVCTVQHENGGWTCQFCAGGLFACSVCGAFEGATPDECPGVKMTEMQTDQVYAGVLNYRAGEWRRNECCRVMRPIHDKVNYMKENGYVPNGRGGWDTDPEGVPDLGLALRVAIHDEPAAHRCATCDGGGCGDCV